MKSSLECRSEIHSQFLRYGAALTSIAFILCGTRLSAQTHLENLNNISTEKQGAVVIYSTPLSKGISPDLLINGNPGSVSFSKKNSKGPHLMVIDLGQSYKIHTIKLSFTGGGGIDVYALKTKPNGHTPWANLIEGAQPDAVLDSSGKPVLLNGIEGEYLVIVSEGDPGELSDLYVTGFHSDDGIGYADHRGDHDHEGLGETPHDGHDFDHPHVPPVSP